MTPADQLQTIANELKTLADNAQRAAWRARLYEMTHGMPGTQLQRRTDQLATTKRAAAVLASLRARGVVTVADLAILTKETVLAAPGSGTAVYRELCNVLRQHNLRFRGAVRTTACGPAGTPLRGL